MTTTVQKWGNSLALRIPSSIAKDIDLHQGSPVDLKLVAYSGQAEGCLGLKPRGCSVHAEAPSERSDAELVVV